MRHLVLPVLFFSMSLAFAQVTNLFIDDKNAVVGTTNPTSLLSDAKLNTSNGESVALNLRVYTLWQEKRLEKQEESIKEKILNRKIK